MVNKMVFCGYNVGFTGILILISIADAAQGLCDLKFYIRSNTHEYRFQRSLNRSLNYVYNVCIFYA